jgi:iron complex transport system substrate-binding protein
MRILSLLPSATETIYALGLEEELVGVGRASDFPPEIESVPVVTGPMKRRTPAPASNAPAEAPADPSGAQRAAARSLPPSSDDELETGAIDIAGIEAAEPDVIFIGRATSEVKLRDALVRLDPSPQIVTLDPSSIEGIFHAISTVGSMTETEDDAIDLIEELREDIAAIEQQVLVRQDQGLRPKRVVVLQGLDPLLASGRWIPEQVRRSGGWDLLGRESEAASPTTWEAVRDVDPEMLIFAPVGLTLLQTQALWRKLERPAFWEDIDAVRRGQVFFVEPVYLNRPGPRVVDGMGMLAEIFDPDAFVDTSPPDSWTPLVES